MNRIVNHLNELKTNGDKGAIFFITAGDPDVPTSLEIMKQLAENGADCIELGMPFSDPIADGPTIQNSTARALKNKVQVAAIFEMVHEFRCEYDTPVLMMGYYNPILRFGMEKFVAYCAKSGVDGLIVADLPYEEGEEFETLCREHGVSLIYLLAPHLDPNRTAGILQASSGFVYVVAQYSTTGVEQQSRQITDDTIASLHAQTELPIYLGFGISSTERVAELSSKADGIIIGSWLIKELEAADFAPKRAGEFVRQVKQAL